MTDEKDLTPLEVEGRHGAELFHGILAFLTNSRTSNITTDIIAVGVALGYYLASCDIDPEDILSAMAVHKRDLMTVINESYREAKERIASGELRRVPINYAVPDTKQ